ncbi:hypothetical protein VF04_22535 [Nostoc linckia z7]|uniref:Uncharacterized protein n=1 Tax=Nostoc linckia z7 TaxID=1628745 RepID=A0ABX4KIC8_NOSLI|nr:hypothetical protein VF04_22535 [Nostoc linckia z7]
METYTTVNASGKVNPVPIGSLNIFPWPFMNASYRTGTYAVSYTFTDFCNNCVRHILDSLSSVSAISRLAGEGERARGKGQGARGKGQGARGKGKGARGKGKGERVKGKG